MPACLVSELKLSFLLVQQYINKREAKCSLLVGMLGTYCYFI